MTTSFPRRMLLALLLLPGCRTADEPSDPPSSSRDAPLESSEAASDVDAIDAIAALLRARHADDLPSAEDLAKYPSAEASLRELATTAETMLVRTRALAALQHFSSEPTGALLITVVTDAAAHPALRAAALTGLGGQPLDQRPEQIEQIAAALHDTDPRVGLAAVRLLDRFDAGRQALARARDGELPDQVRAAIDARE